MNALTQVSASVHSDLTFSEIEKLADYIAKSNLFGIKTREQAVVLMAIAQAEGRHPALAARDYDIIQNRPAKKSEAMLRDFLQGGGRVEWHTLTDEEADATFSHPAGGNARINWNMERAAKAGLKAKENYGKYPRQMLRSRTVSEGVRTVYPVATSGMYVPEEVADMAPTIEGAVEPAPRKVKPRTPEPEAKTELNEAKPELTWLAKYMAALNTERSQSKWVATFEDACATCSAEPDLVRLMGIDIVRRAFEKGSAEVKNRCTAASSAAFKRLTPPPGASTQPNLALDAEPWNADTGEITAPDRLASG